MSDAALFDMQPVKRPERDPGLSPDRRRTIRQAQDIIAGYHPLLTSQLGRGPWARLHEQASRTAIPERGLYTCGSCAFRILIGHHDKSYPKCVAEDGARITHGAGSDVRAWWPACRDWEPGDNAVSPDAARWMPEVAP